MRRSIYAAIVTAVGILILADLVVASPALGSVAGFLTGLLVLLAAAAAIAGVLSLLVRHGSRLVHDTDRVGSFAVLLGIALVLLPGLAPGSSGADAPAVRWIVAALLAPLVAAVFAMLFPLLLGAARRGLRLRGRETAVMLSWCRRGPRPAPAHRRRSRSLARLGGRLGRGGAGGRRLPRPAPGGCGDWRPDRRPNPAWRRWRR